MRRKEPVSNTCPDINNIIRIIKDMVGEMNGCDDRDEKEDLLIQIKDWSRDLTSIGAGKGSEMETLRQANSSLREWGWELLRGVEELEESVEELEMEISRLEEEIEELKEKIKDLQEETE